MAELPVSLSFSGCLTQYRRQQGTGFRFPFPTGVLLGGKTMISQVLRSNLRPLQLKLPPTKETLNRSGHVFLYRPSVKLHHSTVAKGRTAVPLQLQYPVPLLQHPTRVRFFTHAAFQPIFQNQVRTIAFSSIPRMALSALRLPTLIAGTTVAGVTLANNKITGNVRRSVMLVETGISLC